MDCDDYNKTICNIEKGKCEVEIEDYEVKLERATGEPIIVKSYINKIIYVEFEGERIPGWGWYR